MINYHFSFKQNLHREQTLRKCSICSPTLSTAMYSNWTSTRNIRCYWALGLYLQNVRIHLKIKTTRKWLAAGSTYAQRGSCPAWDGMKFHRSVQSMVVHNLKFMNCSLYLEFYLSTFELRLTMSSWHDGKQKWINGKLLQMKYDPQITGPLSF